MYTDLLEYAVDLARSLGASYAEARYHANRVSSIVLRNDRVLGAGVELEEGIGVRVIFGNVMSFAATNTLSREGVREAVESAIAKARSLAKSIRRPQNLAEAKVGRARYEVIAKRKFDAMSIEQKIEFMKDVWRHAVSSVREAKLTSFAIEYGEYEEVKEIVSSDGAHVVSYVPRIFMSVNLVLAHPQKGTAQRIVELGACGGLELLEDWKVGERVAEEVKAIENVLLHGVEPPHEPVDVVIGSEVVGLIVHESAGHPMEADRIWGREAAQAGESFVKPEMIGRERIGNEHATVVDDPTIPGSFGFYLYDDEGVPARARYIYFRGLINEPLHSRWTAYIFNTRSNAAARAMNYASEPIPRMANTYLEPGDYRFDELIEDIKLGVYVKSYMEWNIDDIRWGQRYVGLEAYMIRNGELAEPVRNPVLEFTTRTFYSSIVAKSRDLRFYPGICGKGEPMQGVPVWFGGPDVRIAKIRLGVAPR
ncbi:MAG TPA: TldD/PmbA family protein [Ignisphaera aggregans]|uniref:TldD/PmbA family protein n=1 Tax=Ignisphaera aggregans TaxID=334771 RepID=A0A832YY30_9CREN|nr:TldD/PmbA family protein [Ignisphaera aggregans]